MAIFQRKFVPALSVPLVMEYEELCKRPGMVPNLNPQQIDAILDMICSRGEEHRIYFGWRPFLPDLDDDMLVELAIAANAHYIVTSNLRDFEPVERLGIRVLEPGAFHRILPRT